MVLEGPSIQTTYPYIYDTSNNHHHLLSVCVCTQVRKSGIIGIIFAVLLFLMLVGFLHLAIRLFFRVSTFSSSAAYKQLWHSGLVRDLIIGT